MRCYSASLVAALYDAICLCNKNFQLDFKTLNKEFYLQLNFVLLLGHLDWLLMLMMLCSECSALWLLVFELPSDLEQRMTSKMSWTN